MSAPEMNSMTSVVAPTATITVAVTFDDQALVAALAIMKSKLDNIGHQLDILTKKQEMIMLDLTALQTAVETETTVEESVIVLLNQLASDLAAAQGNQTAIDAVVAQMTANADSLAAAVTANTPVPPSV